MARLRENFQSGFLTDDPLSETATVLNSAEFAGLREVVAPDILVMTLDPEGIDGPPEIVWVTEHVEASTSVEVVRGQELTSGGNPAREHLFGIAWEHRATAEDFVTEPHAHDGSPASGGTVSYDELDDLPPIDGAAGVGSLRTLGAGVLQAAAGTHGHPLLHPEDHVLRHLPSGADALYIARRKTATETVADSTVNQLDDELSGITFPLSSTWIFKWMLFVRGDPGGDITVQVDGTSTTFFQAAGFGTLISGTTPNEWQRETEYEAVGVSRAYGTTGKTAGFTSSVMIDGLVVFAASGTPRLDLLWAQRVSNPSSTNVLLNSYFIAWRRS